MITFGKADFSQFIGILKTLKAKQRPEEDVAVKCIIIPTKSDTVRILHSYRELVELENMLDAADTELQSLELMELFKEDKLW